MNWFWWKRPEDSETSESPGLKEARKARQKSEKDLRDVRARRLEVEHTADFFRALRGSDPLLQMFYDSVQRKRGEDASDGK